MSDSLATIDGQLQLLVSFAAHGVQWLREETELKCVVEVVGLGLIRIRPLERWAEVQSLNVDDAERYFAGAADQPWADLDFPWAFLVTAKRKSRTGPPLHEVKLPPLAILALFSPDYSYRPFFTTPW
jgi:hypothetical protein